MDEPLWTWVGCARRRVSGARAIRCSRAMEPTWIGEKSASVVIALGDGPFEGGEERSGRLAL